MSDVYEVTGNTASMKRLLNRQSDTRPIKDADVATDADISHSKLRQYITDINIPIDPVGGFRDFTIRHGLDVVPTFVTVVPMLSTGGMAFYVKQLTKDVVIVTFNTSLFFAANFRIKVDA